MASPLSAALPDPSAARRALIDILGLVTKGAKAQYNAETEGLARQAFDIARGITALARASFQVSPNALEIRAKNTAGRVSFGWKEPGEIGYLIDPE